MSGDWKNRDATVGSRGEDAERRIQREEGRALEAYFRVLRRAMGLRPRGPHLYYVEGMPPRGYDEQLVMWERSDA